MKSIREKLHIKEDKNLLLIDPPEGYSLSTGSSSIENAEIIQIFISSQEGLENFALTLARLKKSCALWITYPKASPHLGINRDSIAAFLLPLGWKGIAICAIDAKWSALRFKAL